MKPSDALAIELGPNQSVMAEINSSGDFKTIWDRTKPDEVELARNAFRAAKTKGFMAYKVEGKEGKRGEVLHDFDPDAERIILAPPMRGGMRA
jgi:hypothetical protein